MNLSSTEILKSFLPCLAMALASMVAACGGTYSEQTNSNPPPTTTPPPSSTGVRMQGSWEIYFHSNASTDDYIVLEANLSQAGSHVFAGAPSALLYQGASMTPLLHQLKHFGGRCESGGSEEITFDGTLDIQKSANAALAFTLTENGALGSAMLTASSTTNGSNIQDGTYSLPAACGFPEDHGTFQGFRDFPRFSGIGSYHGTFNSGADKIILQLTSDPTGFGLTVRGTDNGAPFTLSGSTVGISLTLTGTVSGHTVVWFGLYDSTYNEFTFYESNAKLLGSLSGNPLAP